MVGLGSVRGLFQLYSSMILWKFFSLLKGTLDKAHKGKSYPEKIHLDLDFFPWRANPNMGTEIRRKFSKWLAEWELYCCVHPSVVPTKNLILTHTSKCMYGSSNAIKQGKYFLAPAMTNIIQRIATFVWNSTISKLRDPDSFKICHILVSGECSKNLL